MNRPEAGWSGQKTGTAKLDRDTTCVPAWFILIWMQKPLRKPRFSRERLGRVPASRKLQTEVLTATARD